MQVVRFRNMGFFESPSLRVEAQNDGEEMVVQTGLPKNCKFFGIKRVVIVRVVCANKLIFALQLTITCERCHIEPAYLMDLRNIP